MIIAVGILIGVHRCQQLSDNCGATATSSQHHRQLLYWIQWNLTPTP